MAASNCYPSQGRREFFRQAKQKPEGQETDGQEPQPEEQAAADGEFEFDAERIVGRVQGREGWLRDAKRQLEQRRWQDPDPISRSRASGWRKISMPSAVGTRRMRSIGPVGG
jgi:hypothetical protein